MALEPEEHHHPMPQSTKQRNYLTHASRGPLNCSTTTRHGLGPAGGLQVNPRPRYLGSCDDTMKTRTKMRMAATMTKTTTTTTNSLSQFQSSCELLISYLYPTLLDVAQSGMKTMNDRRHQLSLCFTEFRTGACTVVTNFLSNSIYISLRIS